MIDIDASTNVELDRLALKTDAKVRGKTDNKTSVATALVEIAMNLHDFMIGDTGETFGVPRCGPKVIQMLRGGTPSLRSQLSRLHFQSSQKAAPQQALADALLVLEGIAQESEPKTLHQRVARHSDATWLDLGDATGRAVRISRDGWSVEPEAPVLFKRTALTGIFPEPQRGGSLDQLWSWLNVAEDDRPLVAAWLVAVLHADIPHPILSLAGEQGSGKSTAEKVLVSVLDPSPVPLRKPPRDVESWVTAASGSWIVGIDNISTIHGWFSDALCRAVTGDGDVRRRLYTDGDVHVFSFRRCLILNGIDIGAVRGDLADRLLAINLNVIAEDRRLTEGGLWPRWAEVHPQILGAVLDLAAGVARMLPSVGLVKKPRMADFAEILATVDMVLGMAGLHRYLNKQGELAADSLTADAFVQAIEAFGDFVGTSSDLMAKVVKPDKLPHGWPTNARAATQLLRRQAPVMRKAGWHIEDDSGSNHDKVTRWTIRPRDRGISSPHDPQPRGLSNDAGVAGLAGQKYGQSRHEVSNGTELRSGCRPIHDCCSEKCLQCGGAGETLEYYFSRQPGIAVRLHRQCEDRYCRELEERVS